MSVRTILIGPALFEFQTFREWVNHAKKLYAGLDIPYSRTIAIDRMGRICASGREFDIAARDFSYPVQVYSIEPSAVFAPEEIQTESPGSQIPTGGTPATNGRAEIATAQHQCCCSTKDLPVCLL